MMIHKNPSPLIGRRVRIKKELCCPSLGQRQVGPREFAQEPCEIFGMASAPLQFRGEGDGPGGRSAGG